MKKIVLLFLVLAVVFLTSCAKAQADVQEQTESIQTEAAKTEPEAKEPATQPEAEKPQEEPKQEEPDPEPEPEDDGVIRLVDDGTGESGNQDGMEKTVVLTTKQIGYCEDADPMRLTVNAVQISTITVSDGFSAMVLGLEAGKTATLIVFDVDAENMSDESITIRLDTSMIVLNTNEQASASEFLSGDASGDFLGKSLKNGQVFFICESAAEEIETIRWRIDPPTNAAFDRLGDGYDIRFEIVKP